MSEEEASLTRPCLKPSSFKSSLKRWICLVMWSLWGTLVINVEQRKQDVPGCTDWGPEGGSVTGRKI